MTKEESFKTKLLVCLNGYTKDVVDINGFINIFSNVFENHFSNCNKKTSYIELKQEFEDYVKNLNELVKSKSEIPKELFNLIVEQARDKKTEILNQYKLIKFGTFFILHKIKLNDKFRYFSFNMSYLLTILSLTFLLN